MQELSGIDACTHTLQHLSNNGPPIVRIEQVGWPLAANRCYGSIQPLSQPSRRVESFRATRLNHHLLSLADQSRQTQYVGTIVHRQNTAADANAKPKHCLHSALRQAHVPG